MKPALFLLALTVSIALAAQNDAHHSGVVGRGESHAGMGFSQTTTTHHFLLTDSGGVIQVTANDRGNCDQIKTIQTHLSHIAEMFTEGNFSIPHFVHDRTPPGVPTMKKLGSAIHYSAEPISNGARLKIESSSPQAIAAIHNFLRFQIGDHETGDPLTVTEAAPRP